ncbi:hypothetical protein GCM10009682_39960 [Luedemannella flava]|uniref:Uncharacterized protein n=1 Tax=Luedemannella flava TaxID=349316 RepID=A0ABN2M8G0_9ACTN
MSEKEARKLRRAECNFRVTTVYATSWRFKGKLNGGEGTPAYLGELAESYQLYRVQLPRLLPPRVLGLALENADVGILRLSGESKPNVELVDGVAELFTLPSNQVVLAVTLWLRGKHLTREEAAAPIANILEKCIRGDITLGAHSAENALPEIIARAPRAHEFERDGPDKLDSTPMTSLSPERHQLVFARGAAHTKIGDDDVHRAILYRNKPPYRPEFVLMERRPDQLNKANGNGRTPPAVGVVTPYISLLYGQPRYVDSSIFLSTVHAVGTAARFRYIWRQAYEQVLRFREQKQRTVSGLQTREDLEELADNLGNLEFDLAFSVEFPLMRVETFQSQLYEAMDLEKQAGALSQMFTQLGGSVRSELTAIEVRERREAESRQRWNSIAAGVLSLIGVPVGFVVAFLGANIAEVQANPFESMWSEKFAVVYLVASCFAFAPGFVIAFPHLRNYVKRHVDRKPLGWGLSVTLLGVATLAGAIRLQHQSNDLLRLVDVVAISLGGYAILAGLTVTGLWFWWKAVRDRKKRTVVEPESGQAASSDDAPTPVVPAQREPVNAA